MLVREKIVGAVRAARLRAWVAIVHHPCQSSLPRFAPLRQLLVSNQLINPAEVNCDGWI